MIRHGEKVFFLAKHTLNISPFYRYDKPFILFLNRCKPAFNRDQPGFNTVQAPHIFLRTAVFNGYKVPSHGSTVFAGTLLFHIPALPLQNNSPAMNLPDLYKKAYDREFLDIEEGVF